MRLFFFFFCLLGLNFLGAQGIFHPTPELGIQVHGEVFFNQTGPGKASVPYLEMEVKNVMTTETQWVQKGSSVYEFDVEMGLLGRIRLNNPIQGRTVWTYHYDETSALQKITDSAGQVVAQWFRDPKGVLVRKVLNQELYTEIEPHQLDFTYFPDGSLKTLTRTVPGKPTKAVTTFTYAPGKPYLPISAKTVAEAPSKTPQVVSSVVFAYDSQGRLVLKRETDSQGLVTSWTYGYPQGSSGAHPSWKKTSWVDKSGKSPLPGETIKFIYDAEGNLLQAGDIKIQWSF